MYGFRINVKAVYTWYLDELELVIAEQENQLVLAVSDVTCSLQDLQNLVSLLQTHLHTITTIIITTTTTITKTKTRHYKVYTLNTDRVECAKHPGCVG